MEVFFLKTKQNTHINQPVLPDGEVEALHVKSYRIKRRACGVLFPFISCGYSELGVSRSTCLYYCVVAGAPEGVGLAVESDVMGVTVDAAGHRTGRKAALDPVLNHADFTGQAGYGRAVSFPVALTLAQCVAVTLHICLCDLKWTEDGKKSLRY